MRIRIATLLLSAALIPTPAHAQANASVEGIVADRVTGLGIPNVPVIIYTRQAVRYETISGSDGRFRVTGMAPGIYETRAEPPKGYQLYRGGNSSQMDLAPLGMVRTRVELTREIAIRGRVLDSDGKPASGVPVKYAGHVPVATDDSGEFELTVTNLGSFLLSALPRPNPKRNSAGQLVSPVTTYFPSAINPTEAQPIPVRGDADIENIEIRLQALPVYRVQGKVNDESGNPLPREKVLLVPLLPRGASITSTGSQTINGVTVGVLGVLGPGIAPTQSEAQATTDAEGKFEFPAVPAGDWQVVADMSRSGVTSFSIGRGDVLGLEIGSAEPFRMTSSMDTSALSGSIPAPPPTAALILSPVDARSQVASLASLLRFLPEVEINGNAVRTRPVPDGGFEMPAVEPGRYYVLPTRGRNASGIGSGNYYASAILLGGTDVMGRPVDLAPGAPPLRVIYKPASGGVRGRVTNSQDATVLVLPQNLSEMQAGYFAHAQNDGSFELPNVPPGDYAVVAFDRLDISSLTNDPVIVRRALQLGKQIKIEASQITVELASSRWPE